MSAVPCDFGVDCRTLVGPGADANGANGTDFNGLDFPITNYSSEAPSQVPVYPAVIFATLWDKMGCLSLCTSTISQNAANLCALAQVAQCNPDVPQCPPNCVGGPGGPGGPMTFFFSAATSCSCSCGGGSAFTYFVPAGIFSGQTQAIADALANAFACSQCNFNCQPPNPQGTGGGYQIGLIPAGCINVPYSVLIPRSRQFVLWTITAGALPPGLELNAQTGLISGTSPADGSFAFQIRAYNVDGNYAQRNYALCIVDVFPATLPNAEVGVVYFQALTATSCAPGTLAWQVASGFLPDGLTLNGATGVITGTPILDATYNFVISITSATLSCQKAYTMTVDPCTNITNGSPLPDADVGVAYSEQLNSIGIASPVWSIISGTLPTGLSLSASGLISGTPTVVGLSNFTAQVTGDDGTCGKAFALTVAAGCPDWDATVWDPPSLFTFGGGATASATFITNTLTASVAVADQETEDASVSGLGFLTYNGPGCNCNFHYETTIVESNGQGGVQFQLNNVTDALIVFNTVAVVTGVFDIPFVIPTTGGVAKQYQWQVAVGCGGTTPPAGAASVDVSAIITNLP